MNTELKFSVSSPRANFTKIIIIVKLVPVNDSSLKIYDNFIKREVDDFIDTQSHQLWWHLREEKEMMGMRAPTKIHEL